MNAIRSYRKYFKDHRDLRDHLTRVYNISETNLEATLDLPVTVSGITFTKVGRHSPAGRLRLIAADGKEHDFSHFFLEELSNEFIKCLEYRDNLLDSKDHDALADKLLPYLDQNFVDRFKDLEIPLKSIEPWLPAYSAFHTKDDLSALDIHDLEELQKNIDSAIRLITEFECFGSIDSSDYQHLSFDDRIRYHRVMCIKQGHQRSIHGVMLRGLTRAKDEGLDHPTYGISYDDMSGEVDLSTLPVNIVYAISGTSQGIEVLNRFLLAGFRPVLTKKLRYTVAIQLVRGAEVPNDYQEVAVPIKSRFDE